MICAAGFLMQAAVRWCGAKKGVSTLAGHWQMLYPSSPVALDGVAA